MNELRRTTKETDVRAAIAASPGTIATTCDFLDHMLETLGRYAGLGFAITAEGDLQHHLIEDVAITLGRLLEVHAPDACARYGHATVPMDDALVEVTIDIGGRHFYASDLPDADYDHFFRSLAENGRWTVHLRVLRAGERHHRIEAAVKALGLALRQSLRRQDEVFSSKGSARLTWGG